MQLLAVNFHYVGISEQPFPGVHSLSSDAFKSKIEALADRYEMIGLPDVLRVIKEGRNFPSRSCLITFDDGLRCQMEVAMPILDQLKVPAAFFVLGGPLGNGTPASVHKLQWVRTTLGDKLISRLIEDMANEFDGLRGPADVEKDKPNRAYRYDAPEAAKLKWYLNYYLQENVRESMISRLFSYAGFSDNEFVEDVYMPSTHIKELAERNWLGSHGMSHRPLSGLPVAEMRAEISESKRLLEHIGKRPISAFSYPGGGVMQVNVGVIEAVAQAGYICGLTMKRAVNSTLSDPHFLARVDANDIEDLHSLMSGAGPQ